MKKTILITGAYGFVGRYTAREYHNNGAYVIGIGHGMMSDGECSMWGIDEYYSCDITIEVLKEYGIDVEVIIHCAGSGSVGFSIDNPMEDFERNVLTTYYVLEFIRCFSSETKLIYPSSAAVYGLVHHLPIRECAALNPISPYGYHKKMAEELCYMYAHHYGIKVLVARLFSVYGDGLKKQLLWDICRKIKTGENVFWGTGNESRDWIHVTDVATMLYLSATKASANCPIVNIASGRNVSIDQIVNDVFKVYGADNTPVFGGEVNVGNPAHYQADISVINKWGWQIKKDLCTGIKDYVRWFKENA